MAIQFMNQFEAQKELTTEDNAVLGIVALGETSKDFVAQTLKLDISQCAVQLRKLFLGGYLDRRAIIDRYGITEYLYSIRKVSDQTNLFEPKSLEKVK